MRATGLRCAGAAVAVAIVMVLAMCGSAHGRDRTLPPKAAKAIRDAFPNGRIKDVEPEREHGVKLYEVELAEKGREVEVTVSPDGIIVEVEVAVPVKDLPEAVMKTVRMHSKGGRITEAEKVKARAVVKAGKLVRLPKARVFFEVEIVKNGRELEMNVLPDGKLLGAPKRDDDDDDDDHDDDEDDDD